MNLKFHGRFLHVPIGNVTGQVCYGFFTLLLVGIFISPGCRPHDFPLGGSTETSHSREFFKVIYAASVFTVSPRKLVSRGDAQTFVLRPSVCKLKSPELPRPASFRMGTNAMVIGGCSRPVSRKIRDVRFWLVCKTERGTC